MKNVCKFDLDERERKSKQVLRVTSKPKCSTCESIWPGLKRITLRFQEGVRLWVIADCACGKNVLRWLSVIGVDRSQTKPL